MTMPRKRRARPRKKSKASKNNLQPKKTVKITLNDVSRSSINLQSTSKPKRQNSTAVRTEPKREIRLLRSARSSSRNASKPPSLSSTLSPSKKPSVKAPVPKSNAPSRPLTSSAASASNNNKKSKN